MSHTFTRAYYYYYSPAPLQAVLNNLQVGTIVSSSSSRHYPTRRVLLPLAYIYARPHAALHAQPRPRVPDRGARSARLTHRRAASDDDDEHSNCEMGACNSCEATAVAAVNGRSASGRRRRRGWCWRTARCGGSRWHQGVAGGEGGGRGRRRVVVVPVQRRRAGARGRGGGGGRRRRRELQPGQLYFVLPPLCGGGRSRRRRWRRSLSRQRRAGGRPRRAPRVPEAAASAADPAPPEGCRRSRTRRHSRGRDFVPDLGAIAE